MAASLFVIFQARYAHSALTGDFTWDKPATFEPMSRGEMFRLAYEMKDFSWQPRNEIRNITNPGTGASYTYSPLLRFTGIAYTLANPIEDWDNFYHLVSTVPVVQDTSWGNDCSGFVSISWKLPQKYNTTMFECDAFNDSVSCASVGTIGDYVDALGSNGDGVLFD